MNSGRKVTHGIRKQWLDASGFQEAVAPDLHLRRLQRPRCVVDLHP